MGQTTVRPRATQQVEQPQTWNFDLQPQQGKILAFSGKLGAGKDSMARYLYSLAFIHVLNITPRAEVNEETGKLWVESSDGFREFDDDARDPQSVAFMQQHVWPFMRKFSTADPLKEFLFKMFQMPVTSLWGTQEQKLEPIPHLLWENMSGDPELKLSNGKKLKDMSGPMTGRDMMEFFGTEVVRKVFPRAHAKALVHDISQWGAVYSLVNDIRFIDEVSELREAGGKVIRLTRCTPEAKKNKHKSNCELDSYEQFDAVIDNANMTMQESFVELLRILTEWDWFKVVS